MEFYLSCNTGLTNLPQVVDLDRHEAAVADCFLLPEAVVDGLKLRVTVITEVMAAVLGFSNVLISTKTLCRLPYKSIVALEADYCLIQRR
jgi:hypothetical protein